AVKWLRAPVIHRGIAGDGQEPRRELRQVAAVPMPMAPGLLERDGRQVLGERLAPQPIAQKVVDAWQLLGEDEIPGGLARDRAARRLARILDAFSHHMNYERAGELSRIGA